MHKANRKRNKEIAALKKMKVPRSTHRIFGKRRIGALLPWAGSFVRSKEPVTIRIDADVLNGLKSKGKGYQTRINQLLRAAMRQSKVRKRA